MNKYNYLLGLALACSMVPAQAYSEVEEKIEQLAACTAARKGLKNSLWWEKVAIIPAGVIGASLTDSNKAAAFCIGAGITGLVYLITAAIRMGNTYLAQYYFHKLYNKRVDTYGNLVSPFAQGAEWYGFALGDQQFILFGRAAGFSTQELIRMANKCGRTEVAARLGHGEQIAHSV